MEPNAVAGEGCGEAAQPGLDIADRAAVAPVTLGGEVGDPPGCGAAGIEQEDSARPQPALGAGAAVGEEGVRVAAPELEGEAGACDAEAVDGVDDGLGRLGEDVAVRETDHDMLPIVQRAEDRSGLDEWRGTLLRGYPPTARTPRTRVHGAQVQHGNAA